MSNFKPFKLKVFGEPIVELYISSDIEARESEKLSFEKLMTFL